MVLNLLELGRQPISSEKPAGDPVRYEAVFEELQNEITKLDSVYREPIDWNKVVDLAASILATKSKDLLVASYLSLGLFQKQGYEGLSQALALYCDLLENFWETLYPELKRIKGRIGAIEWLSERVGKAIARRKPEATEKELVDRCDELLMRLWETMDAKFGPDSPGLSDLRSALQDHIRSLQPVEAKPVADQPSSAEPPKTAPPMPAPALSVPQALSTVEDAEKIIDNARDMLLRAADFLREADPTNPLPYRLARLTCWMQVMQLPSNRNGRTEISGVQPDLSKRLDQALTQGEWRIVLDEAEGRFREAIFWLDAHRFVAQAMQGLGSAYEQAQKAVREELAALVLRLPGLLELRFRNDVPFADERTKAWIESEVLASAPQPMSVSPAALTVTAATAQDQERLHEITQEARRLVAAGKLAEALALFQKAINSTSMRRERFLWRLGLAKLCLEAGRPQVALPQLEALDEDIKRFSLEEWEPELCLDVVRTALLCQQRIMDGSRAASPKAAERALELYARLCRLDVLSALTLDNKNLGRA